MKLSLLSLATLAGAVTATTTLDPIVIKGSKFFYSSNETQFYMRGVAYQYSQTEDPLSDETTCKRDVAVMRKLRTNVIRTYYIDPTADHSACMDLLAEAGIYVVSDLSSTTESINRNDPAWNVALYDRYTSVIDELSQYNNTIGFFAGNEVANSVNTTAGSAYVKAAVRDMKKYIKEKNYRAMGVGYATADVSTIREDLANYFDCDTTEDAVDFWGYNVYSWCGKSTYEGSGYKDRTAEFANYTVPVFFAEYGCNEVSPRPFTEVTALYGDDMAAVWSGGIVYMYFQETNDYGLVSVIDSTSVSLLDDFTSYSKHIATVSPTGVSKASYTATNTELQACPTVGASWEADPSPLPPTADSSLCSCIYEESACVAASLSDTKMSSLIGTVCGLTDCSGLDANATSGVYGVYSMCGLEDQLAFALNKYYNEQDQDASACSFGGSASTKATTAATGACSSQIKQAGTAGTGIVTTKATATAGSGSSSGSSSTSTSKGAAAGTVQSSVVFGSFQVGLCSAIAAMTGLGMILL
ncbi:hypothetical protein N7495_001916 [Penicillium taxi]|uniref:uncharacterized protein n=1 Tax=Penicillium taxi TaxID=168475 RepID=UPI0025452314|nr:uncharacterized protein N7495_001916 [Penicillium taxi]KAJ5909234.1 hypothetical protein N7495_001916 [Penicillium taxi]